MKRFHFSKMRWCGYYLCLLLHIILNFYIYFERYFHYLICTYFWGVFYRANFIEMSCLYHCDLCWRKKTLRNKINRQYLLLEVHHQNYIQQYYFLVHHQNYIQQYYFLVNLNRSQEKREVFTFVKKDKRFYWYKQLFL